MFGLNRSTTTSQVFRSKCEKFETFERRNDNFLQKSVNKFERRSNNFLQKSASANSVIETKSGFKPSDRCDPRKREFLTSLSKKIWHYDLVSLRIIYFDVL